MKKEYKYGSKEPMSIDSVNLTDQQRHKLMESKVFCMIPWIHIHGYPDGRAYPCCMSEMDYPIGDMRSNTLKEIWNSNEYKQLRVNMINEIPSKECKRCYEQESVGFTTLRNSMNKFFGHHINLVDKTNTDGRLDEFKLIYYDIRFSNLCNFKCRTCGGIFSSNWYSDDLKINKVKKLNRPQIIYAGKNENDMWEQMQEHIPYLEQIYFAGGEPLIMKEHWMVLDELIKREMFHVKLIYNTNFSETVFKGRNVFEMWKNFECVSIGASLDASHDRGEFIRKGQNWKETVENREQMLKICPDVDFYISSTLSFYNALHLPDFHKEWVDLGLITPKDWNINILQTPYHERIDVLPEKLKRLAKEKYEEHLKWLIPNDRLTRATIGYKSAIEFMMAEDNSHLLEKFLSYNLTLDQIRSENFWKIFPEYSYLREINVE